MKKSSIRDYLSSVVYRPKFWLAAGFTVLIVGCVSIENHQYQCDEVTATSDGLEPITLTVEVVGTLEQQLDTFLYSRHLITAPYELRLFFDGRAHQFADFKVEQAHAEFSSGGVSKQHMFNEINNVKVHKSNTHENGPETHIIELLPQLTTTDGSNFQLTVLGQSTDGARKKSFRYTCQIKYKHISDGGFAIVN